MEALWSRFNPTIKKTKELVDSGDIGELKYINADFAFYALDRPKESRLFNLDLAGGTILDIGIYPVFLSYLLLGKPELIKATSKFNATGTEIQTAVILEYKNAQALLYSSFTGYTLKLANKEEHIHLPTIGRGYTHEILEVNACIRTNKLESSLWSHSNSLELIGILDAIREKSGVYFPFEA